MAVPACIETPTKFARYTVAEATPIPLYTMLKLADPHTASAATGAGEAFAGIAWEEFTGGEGLTEITVAKNGVWDIQDAVAAGGSAGAMVVISGANLIRDAAAGDLLTGAVVGKREEDASASEVTRIRMDVI